MQIALYKGDEGSGLRRLGGDILVDNPKVIGNN